MPEIKSPITNKQIRGPAMRDLTVTDESGYTPPQQQPPIQRPHRREEVPQFDPQAMREFEAQMQPPRPAVPMNELSEEEKRIIELKKAKREGKERLSDGARRRIEMLIGMTRLSREVQVEGQTYKIQTLSSKDLRDVMVAVSEYDGTVEFMFEHRKQTLARSLTVVAGVDITQFLNSYELQDRLDFIELMDNALLIRLFSEYAKLDKEANDKYALKTDAEVVAVVEDLKK
jgi:hypothetical protein